MNEEEIKLNIIQIVKKLIIKFEKSNWKKAGVTEGCYILSFDNVGKVYIERQHLSIYNSNGIVIGQVISEKPSDDVWRLWGMLQKKFSHERDITIRNLITELDNLK